MTPSFQPGLINDPFSDPGLFISFLFDRRAVLFDLGDLSPLSPKNLLKITHAFVTHAHMDHFVGFDSLLRVFLARDKRLHLFGPPGFFERVEGKLAGYTWNLLPEYKNDFRLDVTEVHPARLSHRTYICREQFRPRHRLSSTPFSGILHKESAFSVQGIFLDHRIPCLGLSFIENFSVNIDKEALTRLGLPVGPWLNRFKAAIYEKTGHGEDFSVTWMEKGDVIKEKSFVFGDLVKKIARISEGHKIVYITDVLGSPENCAKIIDLAQGADILFIESHFLESERELADRKYHLTAFKAGEIANRAGVRRLELFHFSPRYKGRERELEKEAEKAYGKPCSRIP